MMKAVPSSPATAAMLRPSRSGEPRSRAARCAASQPPKRVLCRDARASSPIERLMGGGSAAMAFLGPRYNVRVRDIVGRGERKHQEFAMASGELSREQFVEFLIKSLGAAAAVSRDDALHYV